MIYDTLKDNTGVLWFVGVNSDGELLIRTGFFESPWTDASYTTDSWTDSSYTTDSWTDVTY